MNWTKTCNRFVAFYDIMGFKDMVQRQSHTSILSRMNKLKKIINPLEDELTAFLEQDLSLTNEEKSEIRKTAVKPIIFSDSILIVSNGETEADHSEIIFTSIWLLKRCFEIGLPIKGAISHGKFTADFESSIYFGQPLIDAYLLQDELVMYGAIYDHNFESYVNRKKFKNRGLFQYRVPLKFGKITHYMTDWAYLEKQDAIYRKQISKLYRSVSGRPRMYVDNTAEFLETLLKKEEYL